MAHRGRSGCVPTVSLCHREDLPHHCQATALASLTSWTLTPHCSPLLQNSPWPQSLSRTFPSQAHTQLCTLISSYTKENLQTMKAEIYPHPSQPQNWKLSSKQAWSLHLIQALLVDSRQNPVHRTGPRDTEQPPGPQPRPDPPRAALGF